MSAMLTSLLRFALGGKTRRASSGLPKKLKPVISINSGEELRELNAAFPQVLEDLTETEEYEDIPEVTTWLARVVEQNVTTGSKSRGLIVPGAYKSLEDPGKLTPENVKLANVMAWCYELLQGYMMVHDDILDSAGLRRNAISWHNREGVGLSAINDGVLLENCAYVILKRRFSEHPSYSTFLEFFHRMVQSHALAQTWQFKTATESKANPGVLTMENYRTASKFRSGNFSFYCPVTLALHLAGIFELKLHDRLEPFLLEMGYVVLVENDLRDVFDNLTQNGRVGTDIQNGECSWLIVAALQRTTEAQREVLQAHYGKDEPESVSIVKGLYEELDLPGVCESHVEERLRYIAGGFRRIARGYPNYGRFFEYLGGIVEAGNWKKKEYWCT